MKCILNIAELKSKLNYCSKAMNGKSPFQVYRCVKIDARDDQITLTTTSDSLSLMTILDDGFIEQDGAALLDLRLLTNIVTKNSSISQLSIETEGNTIILKVDNAKYKLLTIHPEDFPHVDFSTVGSRFKLPGTFFLNVEKHVAFAASKKEMRPVLTGVNFSIEDNYFNFVATATDSYRLARESYAMDEVIEAPMNVTIPATAIKLVSAVLNPEKDIEIIFGQKHVLFIVDKFTIKSSLLEGTYPDTNRLIPTGFTGHVTVSRDALLNAVDRTMFIKNDDLSLIRMTIQNNSIIIENRNQEIGNSREIIPAQLDGDQININFAGNYLLDALKAFENGSDIVINFNAPLKPATIVSDSAPNLIQLVLPVKTYN